MQVAAACMQPAYEHSRMQVAALDLDLDNNCHSPDGYFGNGVCTPTGMMQQTDGF